MSLEDILIDKEGLKTKAYIDSNLQKSKDFKLIGITGSKGKTITAYMIKEILEKTEKKVGFIGTLGTYINGKKITEKNISTLESIEIQKILNTMQEEVEYIIIEVPSQSLKLHKIDGLKFDIVAFTNILEEDNTEEYFNTGLELFKMCQTGFTNADDIYGTKIPNLFPQSNIETYGIDNFAKNMARDVSVSNSYSDFIIKISDKNERIKVGIPGRFSVYNALLAICITRKLGININSIKQGLENIKVPGRCEIIENNRDITIMLDYVHSPKSLKSILQTAKTYTYGKVICVLECEDNKDQSSIMGEISGKLADFTFVTINNLKTDMQRETTQNIEQNIKKVTQNYKIVLDKKEAIKKAIKRARKRDMIIIAREENETNQKIKSFDEREILDEILKKN